MKNPAYKIFSFFIPLIICLSCVNTEIIEPENPDIEGSRQITLGLSLPSGVNQATRADGSLALRFVAKLYEGDYAADESKFIQRKEVKAIDGSKIVFTVKENNKKYSVSLFADYIDVNSTPDDNGFFPDKFYDTSSNGDYIVMKSFKWKKGNNDMTVDYNSINNEGYDAFATYHNLTKGDDAYENNDIKLERMVSKVSIKCKSGSNLDNLKVIKLKKFSYLHELSLKNKGCNPSFEITDITGTDNTFELSDKDNLELFWFYTIGSYANGLLGEIEFDLIDNNGNVINTATIPSGKIKPVRNKVMNVIGSFLGSSPSANDESHEIRLTVGINDSWEGNGTTTDADKK